MHSKLSCVQPRWWSSVLHRIQCCSSRSFEKGCVLSLMNSTHLFLKLQSRFKKSVADVNVSSHISGNFRLSLTKSEMTCHLILSWTLMTCGFTFTWNDLMSRKKKCKSKWPNSSSFSWQQNHSNSSQSCCARKRESGPDPDMCTGGNEWIYYWISPISKRYQCRTMIHNIRSWVRVRVDIDKNDLFRAWNRVLDWDLTRDIQ